ncbi:unnamed protein product, partial [Pylaiella littoralis]
GNAEIKHGFVRHCNIRNLRRVHPVEIVLRSGIYIDIKDKPSWCTGWDILRWLILPGVNMPKMTGACLPLNLFRARGNRNTYARTQNLNVICVVPTHCSASETFAL